MDIELGETMQMMSENVAAKIEALMNKGDYFPALGVAYAELKAVGETHATLVQVAAIETKLGLLRRAIRNWERAVQFNDDSSSLAGLGSVLLAQGKFEAAATAFRRIVERDPNDAGAMTSLAIAYGRMGCAEQARQYASRVLLAEPDNLDALICRARSNIALKDLNATKGDLERLVSLPHSRQFEMKMLDLEVHLLLQEWELGLFLAAELCEENPDNAKCIENFTKIFRDFQKQGDQARFFAFLSELAVPWVPSAGVPCKAQAHGLTTAIDVIIPVRAQDTDVKACIVEVVARSGPHLGKLIVVEFDGAENSDGRLLEISKAYKNITLLRNTDQSDFMAAVMLGLRHSTSDAFAVISPKVEVTEGWLDILHRALRSDETAAAAGPLSNVGEWQSYRKVIPKYGEKAFDVTPALRADLLRAAAPGGVADLVRLPMLRGFCVLFDRKKFDDVSGFDPQPFADSDEATIDLSLRLRAAAYNLYAVADCVVFQRSATGPAAKTPSEPSDAARAFLYNNHSALCYLTSLILCLENAQLDAARLRYSGVLSAWF